MKKLIIVGLLFFAGRCFAANGVPAFQAGLQAFQSNGSEALLATWYNIEDDAEKIAKIRERLTQITRGLGPVVDTQVFAPHDIGKHVQRLYGVIYFERRPLWLRAEYYSVGGRSGFISLEFSLAAEDILPLEWASVRP